MIGVIRLIRPARILTAVSFVAVMAALQADRWRDVWSSKVLLGIGVISLTMAFCYVINDYVDADVDAMCKPCRPLPSGRVSRPAAILLAILLALSALGLSMFLGSIFAVFTLSMQALGLLYSYRLKNTVLIGNVVIAGLVASLSLFGSLLTRGPTHITWLIALLVAPLILEYELVHSAVDRDGDAAAGLTTTATMLGLETTLRVCRIVAVVYTLLVALPWVLGIATAWYLLSAIVCVVAPLIGIMYSINSDSSTENLQRSQILVHLLCLTGLVPVVLLN
jgi:geranylgeranylglycerol-phosphate geranylgeranyltransferase